MTNLAAIYSPSDRLKNLGAPHYIKSKPLNFPSNFVVFNETADSESLVSKKDQFVSLDLMMTSNPGWLCYLCGDYSKIKTLSIHMMERYYSSSFGFKTPYSEWLYVNNYTIKSNPKALLSIIDSFTMHDDQFDLSSTRRIYEYISLWRGKKSTIVLCPNANPTGIRKYLIEEPEFILYIR
jgi:hypothetical protein